VVENFGIYTEAENRPARMKLFRLPFLALGLVLFGLVIAQADLNAVAYHVSRLGWAGALAIPAVSLLPYLADTWSWQILFTPPRPGWGWFADLLKVRLVGGAINKVAPAAGLAGEPVKAMILKNTYGVPYREGVAALVVAKTANLAALVVFLATGMALAFADDRLPEGYRLTAAAGFAVLALGIGLVFAVQRLRISSALGTWYSRQWPESRTSRILHHLHDMDDRLVHAYTRDRARFLAATLLAFLYWVLGAVELYLIFWFMGHPVTVVAAGVIAAAVELVRAGTFFVPANIGAEEATFALMVTSVTGEAGLGLAVAFARRYRELLWIGLGFLMAWRMTGRARQPIGTLLHASEDQRSSE
jgi:glycosyltransferase 2 family protein